MHIEIIPMLAAAAAPATVSEWISQYGKMLLEGIWGTVYMTLVSTFIGYLSHGRSADGYPEGRTEAQRPDL